MRFTVTSMKNLSKIKIFPRHLNEQAAQASVTSIRPQLIFLCNLVIDKITALWMSGFFPEWCYLSGELFGILHSGYSYTQP